MMMPSLDFFGSAPQPQRPPQPAPQRPAQVAAQPRPVQPAPARPALPPPTVRMQSQDEPAPRQTMVAAAAAPLTMPSPEQLGVGANRPAGNFDWSLVHRRLDQLGCCCFQMEQQARGCKLVCLLPNGQPGKSHRIEVEAADSAEAARLLLQQADAWVARK